MFKEIYKKIKPESREDHQYEKHLERMKTDTRYRKAAKRAGRKWLKTNGRRLWHEQNPTFQPGTLVAYKRTAKGKNRFSWCAARVVAELHGGVIIDIFQGHGNKLGKERRTVAKKNLQKIKTVSPEEIKKQEVKNDYNSK